MGVQTNNKTNNYNRAKNETNINDNQLNNNSTNDDDDDNNRSNGCSHGSRLRSIRNKTCRKLQHEGERGERRESTKLWEREEVKLVMSTDGI